MLEKGNSTGTASDDHTYAYIYTSRSPASFGKAKRRAQKALPKSPKKRMMVVSSIAKDVLQVKLPFPAKDQSSSNRGISSELQNKVIDFYETDAVSRVLPGKADCIRTKGNDGTVTFIQKRVLVMTLAETYQCFITENDDNTCKIGKSKFAALWPEHVLLSRDYWHYFAQKCHATHVGANTTAT